MKSGSILLGVIAVALLGLAIQPRRLMRVVGNSMAPTYAGGEWLLTRPVEHPLRRGDVVVVDSPRGTLVKRIALLPGERHLQFWTENGWTEMTTLYSPFGRKKGLYRYAVVPQGMVYVMGDHLSQSIDSRDFGPLPVSGVRRIVEDLRPPGLESDVVTMKNVAWKSS